MLLLWQLLIIVIMALIVPVVVTVVVVVVLFVFPYPSVFPYMSLFSLSIHCFASSSSRANNVKHRSRISVFFFDEQICQVTVRYSSREAKIQSANGSDMNKRKIYMKMKLSEDVILLY